MLGLTKTLLVLVCIYGTIAIKIDDPVREVCTEKLRSCIAGIAELEELLPVTEEKVFLEISKYKITKLCKFIEKATFCAKQVSMIPGCDNKYRGSDVAEAEKLVTLVCWGPGRKDIDSLLRCANNPFLQRSVYGKIMKKVGEVFATWKCDTLRPSEFLPSKLTEAVRSLHRSVERHCSCHDLRKFRSLMTKIEPYQDFMMSKIAEYEPYEPQDDLFEFLEERRTTIPIV